MTRDEIIMHFKLKGYELCSPKSATENMEPFDLWLLTPHCTLSPNEISTVEPMYVTESMLRTNDFETSDCWYKVTLATLQDLYAKLRELGYET